MGARKITRVTLGVTAELIFLSACFTAAYFLTSILFEELGQNPPVLFRQLLNSFTGLLIAALITSWPRFRRVRQYRMIFQSIIRALEKITSGDFNVRLDSNVKKNYKEYSVIELVNGVNSMAEELGRMENIRREFISDVSHEIQSPLTSIRGFAEALRKEELSPEERLHYLDIIEAESSRLSNLTNNLLQLSSLYAHTTSFEPRSYRLDAQLRGIILTCEPQWLGKELDLEVALEEVDLVADQDMMDQVWINLIHNSIKFTPGGGSIRVSLHRRADNIEVKVADTGIGIAENDPAHVFERFYKVDKSRARSNKGSGLGLSIAKRIVDIHRGAIAVQSRPGAGTTFVVTLPP